VTNKAEQRVKRQLSALESQVSEMLTMSKDLEAAREQRIKAEKAIERAQKRLGLKESENEML
jgi:ElaB/YqjD/DUF883 family membrane-anchored ribosome-binding protein